MYDDVNYYLIITTGVLLLTNPNVKSDGRDASSSDSELINNDVDLSSWREKVRKDASSFIDLCRETGLCPDLWSLYEWSNWLTPISVGHKRFDTAFYLCCLEKQPKVVLDHTEVTTLKVCIRLILLIISTHGHHTTLFTLLTSTSTILIMSS